MENPDDQIAAMRAALDQLREMSKEVASTVLAYFKVLVDGNMDSEQALSLTISYQEFLYALMIPRSE